MGEPVRGGPAHDPLEDGDDTTIHDRRGADGGAGRTGGRGGAGRAADQRGGGPPRLRAPGRREWRGPATGGRTAWSADGRSAAAAGPSGSRTVEGGAGRAADRRRGDWRGWRRLRR